MALRPAYETENEAPVDTADSEKATKAVDVKAWAAQQAAAAKATGSTEVAMAQTKTGAALALTRGLSTQTVLDQLRDVISGDMLSSMSFGAFPRVVVSPGAFTDKNSGKLLGDRLVIQVLSWNYVTLVTSGEQNNKEANKLVRTSYDGVNLINGEGTVAAYLEALKGDYPSASAKRYGEIYAMVLETAKGGAIAEDDRKITQISIPPTSTGPWLAFLLERKLAAGAGRDVSSVIELLADSKNDGKNTWGVVEFRAFKGA